MAAEGPAESENAMNTRADTTVFGVVLVLAMVTGACGKQQPFSQQLDSPPRVPQSSTEKPKREVTKDEVAPDSARSAMAQVEQPAEIARLEKVIAKDASADSTAESIIEVERMIIDHIRKNGPGRRFVIKEIAAEEESQQGSLCLHANPNGGVMAKTEYPGDKIRIDLSFAGVVAYGEGSRWVPNIFQQTPRGVVATPDIPGGDGSIHRYTGAIPLGVGVDYFLIAEANKTQRLTFAVLKHIGYVYIRGKGIVRTPRGNVVRLGE